MWTLLRASGRPAGYCDEVCGALERTVAPAPDGDTKGAEALWGQLPEAMRRHIVSCEACRAFSDDLLAVRRLFAVREDQAKPQPGPYFLTRVMAAIADRETQLENTAQTWAAVPRLASRLSLLASVGLLIAAGWVYQMPKGTTTAASSATQAYEGLVDSGSPQDDLLVSPADRQP